MARNIFVRSAISASGLDEDTVKVALSREARDKTLMLSGFLTERIRRAIELVFVQGTHETHVSDLARSDREWYSSVCISAGMHLGECGSASDFMKKFEQFLDEVFEAHQKQLQRS